jgi:cytochrome P450
MGGRIFGFGVPILLPKKDLDPGEDWLQFCAWSESILKITYSRGDDDQARQLMREFSEVSGAMNEYLSWMIAARHSSSGNDLLSQLLPAEVDEQHLTQDEILGFFQLLMVGGQETTANLINNAVLSLLENPSQLALLASDIELLPSAIEEALRFRAPIQWVMRTPTREIQLSGQALLPGQLVLAVIGSANRDSKRFDRSEEFDITREPNGQIGFGHGIHFCLGSVLARMEVRIALSHVLERLIGLQFDQR